jgi:hypothetical protein
VPELARHDISATNDRPQDGLLDHDEEPVIALPQQPQAVGPDGGGLVGVVEQVAPGGEGLQDGLGVSTGLGRSVTCRWGTSSR